MEVEVEVVAEVAVEVVVEVEVEGAQGVVERGEGTRRGEWTG